MPWKKGESGNPNGRPRKNRALSDLLRTVGGKKPDGKDQPNKRLLAETLWTMAVGGDVAAARLIYEYVDGKPPQRVQHEGGDSPMALVIEYVNDWHEEDTTTDSTSWAAGDTE